MKDILIIGAFDRYNYGDLLFPIIIEKQLKTYGDNLSFHFYGIAESDLSALGGLPTQDIQAFYRRCDDLKAGKASVIVAGGEAVAVTWYSLLVALNKYVAFSRRYQHHLERLINLNKVAKRILKGRTAFPFVINSDDFKAVDHVVLNSLGGSEIDPALFAREKELGEKLRAVDYFSVRDEKTRERLAAANIETTLFPDSAILMSKFFSPEVLAAKVSREVLAYVEEHKGKYLFFQINQNHAKGKEPLIADQLNQIAEHYGVQVCLCPIGRALNHNDHKALEDIRPLLNAGSTYFGDSGIWDVMYLISQAACYIGTSLHGAITAMSYNVPYVGLRVRKLDSYLSTWGVTEINGVVDLSDIARRYSEAVSVPKELLNKSLERQLNEIERAFERIHSLLMSY